MKTIRFIPMLALFLAITILTGCGGSQMLMQRPLETDLSPFSSLVFSAESNVTEDVTKEIADLEEKVISEIKSLNLFQNVEIVDKPEPFEGKLHVKATITKIKKVGGGKRFLIGAFAGKASMTTDVNFIDTVTGRVLGSYTITGKSGGTGMSGGTGVAIKNTANGIVELISKNHKGNITAK